MRPFQIRQTMQPPGRRIVWIDLPDGHTVEVNISPDDVATVNLVGVDGESFEWLATTRPSDHDEATER